MDSTNRKIYALRNKGNNICYIGSTCKSLKYRLCKHKTDYKRYKKGMSSYYTCFDLFDSCGVDNISIELIEDDIRKEQLLEKEKYYIHVYNTCNKLMKKCTVI